MCHVKIESSVGYNAAKACERRIIRVGDSILALESTDSLKRLVAYLAIASRFGVDCIL